ncbi:septation protein SepH [Curtobacterium flaccumfaciens]|nr:septation protein SepH [Curtobacterium flaccumfaciens]
MQDVRVIGVESGALLLATDGGTEFRLPVTSSLPGQVRQANPESGPHKRVSPKDVQARIRGGADAGEVAAALDVDVEYVRRFEGPVLAERAFILDAAHRVPVVPADDESPDTFGAAIETKLEAGEASGVAWGSWKHAESGWQVRVRYTAGEVEHDAQWRFDPKTSTLTPDNGDAHRLSHTEDEGIAPRLRAVELDRQDPDGTRFDSGAFRVDEPDEDVTNPEVQERPLRAPLPRIGAAIEERAPATRPPTCSKPSVGVAASVRPRASASSRRSRAGRRSAWSTSRCRASTTRRTPRRSRTPARPPRPRPRAAARSARSATAGRCRAGTRSSSGHVPTTTRPDPTITRPRTVRGLARTVRGCEHCGKREPPHGVRNLAHWRGAGTRCGRVVSVGERAGEAQRDERLLVRHRAVLSDHPLRLLPVTQGPVVVERPRPACHQHHVADPVDDGVGHRPNHPAAIASSRLATYAFLPYRARKAPTRLRTSVPGATVSCRQRGSPATPTTSVSSAGSIPMLAWSGTSSTPWSAVAITPTSAGSARSRRASSPSRSSSAAVHRSDCQPCLCPIESSSGT